MPVNANTGNQTTQYVYGSTLADSAIASSLLKVAEVYPDSVDSDDRIKFTYNRQGEVVTKTDQNGTVHAYDFDKLGRRIQDRVTTLGTGVDTAVKRIARTFEVRGMVQNITSYDNATVGSGSIVNDVQLAYNTFGQVIADYQSHSGAVNVATTPKVQYTYASGSANTIRPLTMVSPNGRVLNYSYGTAGSASDALSRFAALVDNDGTTQLVAYQYLGLGTVVEADDTQPDIKYTLTDLSSANDPDTGDIYSGLDRFSRVKDCRWYNYGTSADAARIKHGYDRAGNRLYREDPVATSNGKAFDELYAYDAIYRLRDMQRGTLNGSKTGLTAGTRTFEQCWTLDPTGNWKGFREDSDGNGTWDLVQSRTDNKVNEITGISNSVGSAWVTPAYNRAGNMTTIPQPADPTKGYTGTYDAWNRLVKIVDVPTGQTVQENAFDGRTFRVVKKSYTAGVLSETRQLFFSTSWQVVEERIGAATAAERQFIWGLRYIDDLVVRDRDTTGGGTLNERLYALQDANWNVVALASSAGAVQERYAYSAYGTPVVLTAAFGARGSSSYVWETLYCGYRWDSSTAIYLIRNRIYSGTIGSWLQRDPLGLITGVNMVEYVGGRPPISIDPSGLQVRMDTKWFARLPTKSVCIFTMDSNEADCQRWDVECRRLQTALGNAAYYPRVRHKSSLLARIKEHGCCDIRIIGHQGGAATNGGIVTYPRSGKMTIMLPDPQFEAELKEAFSSQGCRRCSISIYACGGASAKAKVTRQAIANRTGCTVLGAVPQPRMDFITIGSCPGQSWQSLDPRAKPSPDDVIGDTGWCTGPVSLETFVPKVNPADEQNVELQ